MKGNTEFIASREGLGRKVKDMLYRGRRGLLRAGRIILKAEWLVVKFMVGAWLVVLALGLWLGLLRTGVGVIHGWKREGMVTEENGMGFFSNYNFRFLLPKDERGAAYRCLFKNDMWAERIKISGRLPEGIFEGEKELGWFLRRYGFEGSSVVSGDVSRSKEREELLKEWGEGFVRRVYDGGEVRVWRMVRGAVKSSFHYNPRNRRFFLLWTRKYNGWFECLFL